MPSSERRKRLASGSPEAGPPSGEETDESGAHSGFGFRGPFGEEGDTSSSSEESEAPLSDLGPLGEADARLAPDRVADYRASVGAVDDED